MKKVCKHFKGKRPQIVSHVRYWSRSKMLELINNKEALELDCKMSQFAVLTQCDDLIDHSTPPIEFNDLIDQSSIEEWAKAQSSDRKRGTLLNILVTYLMRHFEESDDLADVILSLGRAKIDFVLQVLGQRKDMLHKHLQKRPKEKQIKFAPLGRLRGIPSPMAPERKGRDKRGGSASCQHQSPEIRFKY